MTDLVSKISGLLSKGGCVVLVGLSNSGKTYWVEHKLVPYLEQNNKVVLFKDGNAVQSAQGDIFIFDEAETLFDKSFLEDRHLDERPYYSPKYLEQVRAWHKLYTQFIGATLFIISRNTNEEIDYLVRNFKRTDWDNRDIIILEFKK